MKVERLTPRLVMHVWQKDIMGLPMHIDWDASGDDRTCQWKDGCQFIMEHLRKGEDVTLQWEWRTHGRPWHNPWNDEARKEAERVIP